MSGEHTTLDLVGITRRLYEAGNRRDIDAVMSLFSAHAVLDASDTGLGVYTGADAIRGFVLDWWRSYEAHENVPDEFVPVGSDAVLAIGTLFGRLLGSSKPLREPNNYLFQFQDELIVRWTAYTDTDEARAAAERLAEERR